MEMRTNNIVGTIVMESGNDAHYTKMWDQIGVYGITNWRLSNTYLFLANFFTIGTINTSVVVRVERNGAFSNMGMSAGVTVPLTSEGDLYSKSMTKSAGGQFEWKVLNMPISVGMSGEDAGAQIKFNVVQL